MNNKELLQFFLEADEWQRFECKRAAIQPAKLLETVVAFSNADGGFIIIGVEDPKKAKGNERLIGISEKPDNVAEFLKLIDKELEPPFGHYKKFEIEIKNIHKNKDMIVIIEIEKSNDVHSLKKGDTFIRKGNQNVKMTATEIIRLKYEKGTIKFESELSKINVLEELDQELFNQYKQDTGSKNLDDWQFLKDNGLAIKNGKNYKLTNAGVLLFGNNPSVLLGSKVGVKITHYFGTKANYSGAPNFVKRPFSIEGPLIKQIEKAIEYFRSVAKNAPPKLKGAGFQSSLLIPEWAFQEAITNAVIHRNYFIQDDIQIRFFDDRIEVESPGTYPGHITPGNIRTERFSRNPTVLRTLNRFSVAPNLDIGEGVDRIFSVMKKQNLYEPLYFPSSIRPNSVLLLLFNLQKIDYWDTVSNYINEHYRITNDEARRVTNIEDTLKMSRQLKEWVDKGLLKKHGVKKGAFYTKIGQELPQDLFSRGHENKSQ